MDRYLELWQWIVGVPEQQIAPCVGRLFGTGDRGRRMEFGVTNVEFLTYARFGIYDYLRLL